MPLANACPKPEKTRYLRKAEQVAAIAANEREVYAQVTERDGSSCRVCGKFGNPRAVGLLQKMHHHHLIYRSAGGETTTANTCLLCAACHDAEHRHVLQLSGNADERNEMGKLCGITVTRETEAGWQVEKVC